MHSYFLQNNLVLILKFGLTQIKIYMIIHYYFLLFGWGARDRT